MDFFVREVLLKYRPKKVSAKIRTAEDVAKFVRTKVLRDNVQEHFIAIYLDGSHDVCAYRLCTIGTSNSTHAHPREVFQGAVLSGAVSAIMVAHNHPSGDLYPSAEDREVTKRLADAGQVLGITLLDHVIVTDKAHASFRELGFL